MNQEKIIIGKFNDVLNFVDKDFSSVLILLNKYGIIGDTEVSRSFENKKELRDFLKNLVIVYLNKKYDELKSKISSLRKKGNNLTDVSFKFAEFNLKLKLFVANLDTHSFNKVVLILKKVESDLNNLKINDYKSQ